MRNLKKFLALVLALMMVVSVMVTVSAADFTDQDQITHDEAVNVMAAIDVLQGRNDGSFDPSNTLTRAEAAAIIARMILTPDTADTLPKVKSFDDVALDQWYAGVVNYCSYANIVSGIGGGKFNPSGTLTGYQFGKMVLVATGHDASLYTDTPNWTVNIAVDLKNDGFLADLTGIDLSKNLSREEASQMAFNALTYSDKGETTTYKVTDNTGKVLYNGPDATTALLFYMQDDVNNELDTVTEHPGSLAETVFSLKETTKTTPDAYGRPSSSQWVQGDKEDIVYSNAIKPVVTYTDAVTAADVDKDLKDYTFAYTDTTTPIGPSTDKATEKDLKVSVWKNGDDDGNALGTKAGTEKPDAEIVQLTGNNKTVAIYADANKVVTDIVVIEYKAGKVAETADKKLQVASTDIDTTKYDVAKDDVVVYTLGKSGGKTVIATLEKVIGVKAKLESYTSNGVYTVGGSQYKIFGSVVNNPNGNATPEATMKGEGAIGAEYTYYIYKNFIVCVDTTGEAAPVVTDYAFVLDVTVASTAKTETWPNAPVENSKNVTAKVQLVTSEGKVEIYDLPLIEVTEGNKDVINASTTVTDAAANDWVLSLGSDYVKVYTISSHEADTKLTSDLKAALNSVYTYKVTDGKVALGLMTAAKQQTAAGVVLGTKSGGVAISPKATSVALDSDVTVALDKNTKFVFVNTNTDKTKITATVITGSANLEKATTNTALVGVVATASAGKDGSPVYVAQYVFVNEAPGEAEVTETDVLVYATNNAKTDAEGTTYEVYTADGTVQWLKTGKGKSVSNAGTYKLQDDGTIGDAVSEGATMKTGAYAKVSETSIKVDNDYLNLADGCTTVVVAPATKLADGATVYAVLDKDGEVATIYVTADAA